MLYCYTYKYYIYIYIYMLHKKSTTCHELIASLFDPSFPASFLVAASGFRSVEVTVWDLVLSTGLQDQQPMKTMAKCR